MPSSVIDLEKVCRLCFREDNGLSKMTSIYEQQDLEETIKKCLQIEVLIGSDEPTNICASCILSLNSWSKFKVLCDNTNAFLQQYIKDKKECEQVFNSEISNLGSLSFTPSRMSDLSIDFFESDSLWNSFLEQQWIEVDPTCTNLPVLRYMKKVQPPEDLITNTLSGDECMDMALSELSKKNDSFPLTKTHWWNPKAISMKAIQKENKKPTLNSGMSKLLKKYDRSDSKTYCCNICKETFTKFNDLIIHDSTVHTDLAKTFSCKTCGKLFLSYDRLLIHEKIHREKLFECQLCQKKFTQQKTLDKHLNVHIGLYTCQKCGYKAPSMRDLKIHETTHTLVKDHCCNECDKFFSTQSSMRRHNRLVHQKSVTYRCNQCDYSTIQPSNFKYHKSTHNPQTFICDHCGSHFKNRNLFKIHTKKHKSPEFNCIHCDKKFLKKFSLREHLSSIHEMGPSNKQHKCDVCQKYFSRARNLRLHKNKFHQT